MGAVLRPPSTQHQSELVRICCFLTLAHIRCREKVDSVLEFHHEYHDLLSQQTAMIFDTVHLMNSQDMLQEQRVHCQRQRESAVSLGEKLIDELVLLKIPEQFNQFVLNIRHVSMYKKGAFTILVHPP